MSEHEHQDTYRFTGLRGWIRRGSSRGWGGVPPTVRYLHDTGQLNALLQTLPMQSTHSMRPLSGSAASSREEEIAVSTAQKAGLERSLEEVQRRIEALEKAESMLDGERRGLRS
jgi:hypothetical protein